MHIKAKILIGQIAHGIDPLAEKHSAKMREVTLQQVMQDYLQARKSLKPKTLYDYNRVLNIAFAKWQKEYFDLPGVPHFHFVKFK